jgi:hypothetical protein
MALAYTPDIDLPTIIPHYQKRWRDKYLWVLHSITFQQIRNKENFNGYVNLDTRLLKKLVGDRYYKFVLSQLLNARIIEPLLNAKGTQSYSKGAFAKAYRVKPEILDSTRIKATPILKKTYQRKIESVRYQLVKEAIKLNPYVQHELLQLTYRRIRYNEALEYIEQKYEPLTAQYKARIIALNEFDAMHKAKLSKEALGFHFSYNKGRLYSPASMLPRDLEQFTYFTGYEQEASVCLDMPNSQLCFFDHLINTKVHHIGRSESEECIKANFSATTPTRPPSSLCGDKLTWSKVVRSGRGYERIMSLSEWEGKITGHTAQERTEFKAVFFGQLFYNRYINNYLTPLEIVFGTHYPKEAKALRNYKKRVGNKALAVEVQGLEGKFFHNTIVSYIMSNYIDLPFTIKHDSITLPETEASFILAELNLLLRKFFKDSNVSLKASKL